MSPSISRKGSCTRDFERADGMRQAERAFLLDEVDRARRTATRRRTRRHLVAEMTDDDVDVGDAAVAHHFDLVREQRAIEDRQDGLRAALGERDTSARPCRPRESRRPSGRSNHPRASPETLQRTSSRITRTASKARIFLPSSKVRPRKLTGTSANRAPRCASRAVNSASKSKPLASM